MSYSVRMDDGSGQFVDILSYENQNKVLIEPRLTMEVNEIDSFEFSMPPTHANYTLPQVMKSTVEIYEDGDCIWFGRIISIEVNYYREKHIVCEGALGWLNDIVSHYRKYEKRNLTTLFRDIIGDYQMDAQTNRRLMAGLVTVENFEVSEEIGYSTIYDTLHDKCLDKVEGYIYFRRTVNNGVVSYWIDWLKDPAPYTCNQPIEFGLNLVDFKSTLDGADIFTAILPYGDSVRQNDDLGYGDPVPEGDPRIGRPLVLMPAYDSNIIESNWVDIYGKIVKPVHFSGVKRAQELAIKATAYLTDALYDHLTFEMNAIDLHGQSGYSNYQAFKLGQKVKCKSVPHGLVNPNDEKGYMEFPLLKMEVELDSATKTISIGTAPRKKITDYTNEQAENHIKSSLNDGLIFESVKEILNPDTGLVEKIYTTLTNLVVTIYTDDTEEPEESEP